jgi:hypothetical protein
VARRSTLGTALKLGVVTFAIALPILGAWLASALAAYANGPRWILLPVALLGFPLLPLAWEGVAAWRRKPTARRRILSFSDRLWLRTTALNLVFVGGLVALGPQAALRAVSARGDWFLDGSESGWAASARGALHTVAGSFDALYRLTHDNPYEHDSNGDVVKRDKTPPPMPHGGELQDDTPKPAEATPEPPPPPPPVDPLDASHAWPRPSTLHPAVTSIQPADETTIESVANYIVAHEPSKLGQLKALHDWVADRIAYDPAMLTGVRPPQTAAAVFQRRTGVCAGYAHLLVALGQAAHVQIEYLIGDARGAGGEVDGAGHAWNMATVDGSSYLLDATWDAGYVGGNPLRYEKRYSTDYLFAPPAIFGIDHFPEKAAKQLRTPPISRGDFMRVPQMSPSFFARGPELREPTRSQVTVQAALTLVLTAPPHVYVLASFEPKSGGTRERCTVTGTGEIHATCTFPARGEYRVLLFASPVQYGTYDLVGELLAQDDR